MKGSKQLGCVLLVFLLFFIILVTTVTAYTTEVTVRRYATDGLTPINETTKTYQWLEANLPVKGDGNTYYYFQKPIFENEWEANYSVLFPGYRTDWPGGIAPSWNNSEEKWDRFYNATTHTYDVNERVNCVYNDNNNLGKLKGTDVKDLCNLVGGLPSGKTARIVASDNAYKDIPYSAIYTPTTKLGPFVLTWWSVGAGESGATNGYTGPDYTNGMRTTFFSDTSRNPYGKNISGLGDMAEGLPPEYWYYYKSDGVDYPSLGGWTLKFVDRIFVYSNDPVPPPVADFSGNALVGNLINGDFERGNFSGWRNSSGASIFTKTGTTTNVYSGNYSAKIMVPIGGKEWLEQDMDFTGVETIGFYKKALGAIGVYPYVEVKVDDDVVANSTVPYKSGGYISIETINVSQYEGTHTLRFNVVSNSTSQGLTIYLDTFGDYSQGTTGAVPLTIQFRDLSTKMEDTSHTSWAWDFTNDGTTDKTLQNPVFTYSSPGIYTVKLTATNAAGSDTEIKTGYIKVGVPVTNFTATPRTGTAPLTVQFNDTSTNTPTSWKWAYKNATSGWMQFNATRNASYTFAAGTYDINLTATNAAGSDDEIKTGYIIVGTVTPPPVANFTAMPRTGTAPLTVQFNDTSTNTPTSWKWAYKNATSGWMQFNTTRNASNTFAAGTYDINLTATNAAGSDDEIKTGHIIVNAMSYIDVSISGSIDNWNFVTGTNEDTTSVDLSVDTNMNSWSVGAMDALTESKPGETTGKMAEYSGTAYVPSGKMLANAVQVKSGSGSYKTLTGSNLVVQSGTEPGISSYDIGMKQEIAQTDPALDGDHRYRIVITFTGGAA